MTGITQAEIDLLRSNQEAFLPSLMDLSRMQYEDGSGEYAVLYRKVPCRLSAGFGVWRQVADRFQGIKAYNATLKWDQDLLAGDELSDTYGRIFKVRDVSSDSSYLSAKRCLLEAIEE